MGSFNEVLNDVGAHVAGMADAPPPAIRSAVEHVSRALLGEPFAAARLRSLADRSARVQQLFGLVHRHLMQHPVFQHALSAAHLHRYPLPSHHPKALAIRQGVKDAMHAIEEALPGHLQAVNTAKREEALQHEVGRLHGAAPGDARHLHVEPTHGSRHGDGWRHVYYGPPRAYWEGPWGLGADYLLDERNELEDAHSPDDTEPEWHRGRTWGAGD
jgi:hypothetical protein